MTPAKRETIPAGRLAELYPPLTPEQIAAIKAISQNSQRALSTPRPQPHK